MCFFDKIRSFIRSQKAAFLATLRVRGLVHSNVRKHREKGLYGSFATVFHMVGDANEDILNRGIF
jgi:hypothetical protein